MIGSGPHHRPGVGGLPVRERGFCPVLEERVSCERLMTSCRGVISAVKQFAVRVISSKINLSKIEHAVET